MNLAQIQTRIDRIDGFYQALKNQESGLSKEIEQARKEIDLLDKVSTVLKHLLDVFVKDEVNKIAGLVTYGLKMIFEDQNLTFLPLITKKNEKISIQLKTVNNGIEGEFGSFGGSVAVIESFLLRIICLLKMKLARILLLDESFRTVGIEYIANTSKLIGELSKKLGLDVLLVTHQLEFKNYADCVYRVRESPNGLTIGREHE